MSDANKKPKVGLLTKDALEQLKNDINIELNTFNSQEISSGFRWGVLSPSNPAALVTWWGVGGCMLHILVLAALSQLTAALIVLALTCANLLLIFREDRLCRDEIPRRIQHCIAELDLAARECSWAEDAYPHLCAPFSPCVTLHWTYRDGKLVNLPWALLVRGDAVLLRPGQESPGHCRSTNDPPLILQPRQIYQPTAGSKEAFTSPRTTQPHRNRLFEITETPYLGNLRMALGRALGRPVTVHNQQRHFLMIKCIERVFLPLTLGVCLLASLMYRHQVGEARAHWGRLYLLQPALATLPLLPLTFPLLWTALNIYGMAKFKHLLQSGVSKVPEEKAPDSVNPPRAAPAPVWSTALSILLGREDLVSRSANIVHVLGSVSALCCVDKKGILSWPNPTAEKVFFLRNSSSVSRSSSKTSFTGSTGRLSAHGSLTTIPHLTSTTVAEVLDLTHDQNVPFKLEFDDHSWKNHLTCLKPLGLAILVNTCNMDTQEHYTNFCSHLTCEANHSEDVVPVTNRRCLCELAKQIGFVEEAKSIYTLQTHLATFRHLPPEVIRRDTRFARSLHLNTRVKVPLPHMLGVIIRDQAAGLQLITQGTADIILDSCVEYWNGQDLCVLSPADRKKVLDFYQRSSLTAYCSAFAYRPLTRSVSPRLSSLYLELPADCRSLYPPAPGWSEPHPPLSSHYHSTDSLLFNDLKEEDATDVEGYFDVQCNQVFIGMVTMQYQAQSDMVELIERLDRACIRFVHFSKENELRSRVFSEKMGLESGWNCHISLSSDQDRPASPATSQNLPTPSCSEKAWGAPKTCEEGVMLLQSTLEGSKTLSSSAPGAINLEHTTVKFDSETSHVRYDTRDDSIISQTRKQASGQASQDSVLLGGWEGEGEGDGEGEGAEGGPEGCRSLSCLTDSTDHSAPVNFDMRNRAKLPRGIENIRPHIEQVDNVPLLVSLFTDCTAGTARRMLGIMQDYGQVVCVMGSAANKDNMEIFMQADASIAVEPLYPVLCQKVPPYRLPPRGPGPVDLARTLNSVPCSISESREADVSLFSLVTLARHLMMSLWSAIQYWVCGLCSLTLLQLLCVACGVPPIMEAGAVLWEAVVVLPSVAATLALGPLDATVMDNATNKLPTGIHPKMCLFVMWCYGYKFLPSIITVLASYVTLLGHFCQQVTRAETNETRCLGLVYPPGQGGPDPDWGAWGGPHQQGYAFAQHTVFLMITVLLLTISVSFVHRQHSLWNKSILLNRSWCACVIVLLTVQILFWCTTCLGEGEFSLPLPHTAILLAAPPVILALNELIKWQEIKANLRYQRRARLDFGTKLGMNSPF